MKVNKGDYGFDIIITITDENGNVQNLSGLDLTSTKFKVWKPGDTTNKIDATVQFYTDGTDGKLRYTVQQGDFDTEGVYLAEIKLVWANKVITVDLGEIEVTETAPQ